MNKFFGKYFLLLAFFSICLISCGETSQYASQPVQSKITGEVINVELSSEIENLDPQTSVYTSSFEILGSVMRGLTKVNKDGSAGLDLAVDSKVSDDGLTRTYYLRKDAYWSNGDRVTANDFVYAWQRAVDPKLNSEYSFMMSDIAQIKNASAVIYGLMTPDMLGVMALDDYTLQVELIAPVPFFDELMYFCTFYPANKKFVEACGDKYAADAEHFLSNGPFVLKEYEALKGGVYLEKNPNFYGASDVKIAGIRYILVEKMKDSYEMYERGELDLIELSKDYIADYKNDPEFVSVPSGFMYYLVPNLKNKYLSNLHFRRALNFALDRNAFAEFLADGSSAAWSPVPSGYAFNSRGEDFSPDGVKYPEDIVYDPARAAAEFEIAKKELNVSSFRIKLLTVDSESAKAHSQVLKEQFEKNLKGLTVEFELVESKERRRTMARGEFELGLTNWGPDYADPMTYLSMWMTGNTQNNGRYSDAKYDAIIASCVNGDMALNTEKRWNAMKDAERIIAENGIIFPLYVRCYGDLIRKNVTGIDFHAVALNKVYLNANKTK